jgi:predicted kinase
MSEVLKTDELGSHKTLICMVGLPYSGKSTEAKKKGYPIVCPDAIRVALHGKKFIPEAEPYVWAIAKTMVRSLFLAGNAVVVLDATNTTESRRKEWVSKEWYTLFSVISTNVDECIARATDAGDHVMVPIIRAMDEKFEWPEGCDHGG